MVNSYFEKGCRKKAQSTRPKGSMGRSIVLLYVVSTNDI